MGDTITGSSSSTVARRRFVLVMRSALAYLEAVLEVPVPASVRRRLAAVPVGRLERLEYQVRRREHARLGELPRYGFAYLRAADAGGRRSPVGFARYLQHAWGLPSLSGVPGAAMHRAVRRLRGAPPSSRDPVHAR